MALFLVLGIFIGFLSLVFVLQNVDPVTVTFAVWHFSGSLSIILLLTLLAGMIIAALVLAPGIVVQKWQLRKAAKKIKTLEDDAMLRAAPVASKVTEPAPVQSEPDIVV